MVMEFQDNIQLKAIVESAPVGLCILNAETFTAELLNDKFLEFAGKPKEAIIGKWYWEPFAEAREYYEEALKGVAKTGQAYYANEVELMLIRHGRGENIYATFVYAPVRDKKGQITRIAVWVLEHSTQVNGRRQTEAVSAEVSQEWDWLQNVFRQAPAGICILSGPDLVYEMFNPAYQQILPGRQLLGRPIFEALPELAGTPIQQMLLDVYQTGAPCQADELLVPVAGFEGGPTTDRYFSLSFQARRNEAGNINGIVNIVFEVTGMIRVQQELRQARELADQQKRVYETITSGTPDLMYVFGLDYRFTYANSALLTMWGKTWETAIGKNLLENGYEPWHAEMHEREIDQIVATKKPVRGEVAFPHATLGRRMYDYILIPVIGADGEVEAVAGTTRDVTERRLAEEKLAHASEELQAMNEEMAAVNEEQAASNEELAATNEELAATNEELTETQRRLEEINDELTTSSSRLRMAIKSTRLGTWDYDPRSGELYWSKECRDIYGLPAEGGISFTAFSEHIHPEDRSWVEEAIQEAMDPETGGRYELTYRIIRFDDETIRWIQAHGTVYFEGDQATSFIGTVFDITDIKSAAEQSARLAAIIESSDDAIISKTFDSVITSWNAASQRIFGYTAEEMIGESIYKLIPEDRHEEEPKILKSLKAGERVQHFETKRRTKDGRIIDVSLTISPVKDRNGKVIGVSKIARDITEKKLEETRKNDFIGMVSHELKTPLTSLTAVIQVAKAKLKNNEDVFLAGAMQRANQQVKRMADMINSFLNVSRLESGKIHIEKEVFNIDGLIADIIDETALTNDSQVFLMKCADPIPVNADRDKIRSVISNYLSNAIKYSPKERPIKVGCRLENSEVIVSVEDEGYGISKQELPRLFERYYRAEANRNRQISGFGIGLYLSSEIIARHGGKVWAESQPGLGSTFYFSLPV